MKLNLIFLTLVTFYVRSQAEKIDEFADDGYYLELV